VSSLEEFDKKINKGELNESDTFEDFTRLDYLESEEEKLTKLIKALKNQLGLVGALRFLLQYEKGERDYTKLRRELFKDETVESLIDRMRKEGKI